MNVDDDFSECFCSVLILIHALAMVVVATPVKRQGPINNYQLPLGIKRIDSITDLDGFTYLFQPVFSIHFIDHVHL